MKLKRIVALVTVGGGLAALATSAATTGPRRPASSIVPHSRSDAAQLSGAALAQEIARLRDRLHPTTVPQEPARNLFHFRASTSRSPRSGPAAMNTNEPPASVPVPSLPPPPARPMMELIGIAEQPEGDRVVRTAIISGGGELYLLKEGEKIDSRFRVARISGSVVELTDTENATTFRLALK